MLRQFRLCRTVLLPMICAVGATGYAEAGDVAGSKDHPLISRFKGAEIAAYKASDFDEAVLPVKPIEDREKPPADALLKVEGKVTRINYRIEGNKTALEVMRNYEQALIPAGFKALFHCAKEECGSYLDAYVANSGKVAPGGFGSWSFGNFRYVLAQRKDASGDVYVLLDVMQDESNHKVDVYEQVVEVQAMQAGQVTLLDAATLKRGLDSEGKVTLAGIYFDNDKADLKPESKPALDEMGKLLSSNPALKVYIVGHTDNVGGLTANLDLSQRRADAVAKALVAAKVAPQRLLAKGIASLSPVAPNTNDAGRARNRRVELVVQ